MIYKFYAEFGSMEELTKTDRSNEWKTLCSWCSDNKIIRISCFPVVIGDEVEAFYLCEVNGDIPNEQEIEKRLKQAIPNICLTDREIPVAIDWDRIIGGSRFSKCEDGKENVKVIEPVSLVGLGDYELKTTFSEE